MDAGTYPVALTSFPETFRILRFVRSIPYHKNIICIPLYEVYTHLLHGQRNNDLGIARTVLVMNAAPWIGVKGCQSSPIVHLDQGAVCGFETNDTNVFLGIPFAETTGGQNRWKASKRVASSAAVYNATEYGPSCAQVMSGDSIVAYKARIA